MTNSLITSNVLKNDAPEDIVVKAINEGNYGFALDAVAQFVGSITSNPRSIGKVFSSPKLDKLCEIIGEKVVNLEVDLKSNLSASGTILLVTQIVDSGGHIELIKDYIRLEILEEPITILVTGYFAHSESDAINKFSSSLSKKVSIVSCKHSGTIDKLNFLLSNLKRCPPKHLYLIVSNHDSLAISLASAIKSKVIFIHHGDHHLCLGVHGKNFIHIDPHNLGYFNCRNELGLSNNRYWPLVIRPNECIIKNIDSNIKKKPFGLTTCSCGRYEKFLSNGYKYDYFRLLPKILHATQGTHVHIGALPLDRLEEIDRELQKFGLSSQCFVYIEHTSSLAVSLIENRVDLYLSSFPIGGGKASLEAMSVGVPLLMHDNYQSHFFSGTDLVYPEALSWSDESSLLSILTNISIEDLMFHATKEKSFFEKYYSEEAFFKFYRLNGDVDLSHDIPSVKKNAENALLNFLEYDQIYINYYSQITQLDSLQNINKSLTKDLAELNSMVNDLNRFKYEIVNSKKWKLMNTFNLLKMKLKKMILWE